VSNTSVGEGGGVFVLLYVFDKVCKQEIQCFGNVCKCFGISGTLCVVKFWLSLWLLESNLFNIQIASKRSSAKDSLHNL